MRASVVAICLIATSVARAQPAPSVTYPDEITERPILLPDRMTELGLTAVMPTYVLSTMQPDGTITSRESGLGEYVDLPIGVRHSFGFVELSGAIAFHAHHPSDRSYPSDVKSAGVTLRAGNETYGDASVSFTSFPTGSSDTHLRAFGAGYEYKWHAVPGRFALYAFGGLDLTDYTSAMPGSMTTTPAHSFAFSAAVNAEVQLSPIVGLFGIGSVAVPIEDSAPGANDRSFASISAELLVARGTYDVFANLGVSDVTQGRQPFLDLGVRLRF